MAWQITHLMMTGVKREGAMLAEGLYDWLLGRSLQGKGWYRFWPSAPTVCTLHALHNSSGSSVLQKVMVCSKSLIFVLNYMKI